MLLSAKGACDPEGRGLTFKRGPHFPTEMHGGAKLPLASHVAQDTLELMHRLSGMGGAGGHGTCGMGQVHHSRPDASPGRAPGAS